MIEFGFQWITGMCVGIEFPGAILPTMNWTFVIDLLIFRISIVSWNSDE